MNTTTTTHADPFQDPTSANTAHNVSACLGLVRDAAWRTRLASNSYTPEGLAEELRLLIANDRSLRRRRQLFADLVAWVSCPECHNGLYDAVMEEQYVALVAMVSLLDKRSPWITVDRLIGIASDLGEPIEEASALAMRRLMEGDCLATPGEPRELLTALSGLAGAALIAVCVILEPRMAVSRILSASA